MYFSGIFPLHIYFSSSDFLQWFPSKMFSLKNITHVFLTKISSLKLVISRMFLLFFFPESSFPTIIYHREYNIFLIEIFRSRAPPFYSFHGFILPFVGIISLQVIHFFGTKIFSQIWILPLHPFFSLHSTSCRVFLLQKFHYTNIFYR